MSAEDRVAQIELNLERWVYIVYATAWVDEAGGGQLIFADDLYGHDRKHRALLGLERPQSTRVAQAASRQNVRLAYEMYTTRPWLRPTTWARNSRRAPTFSIKYSSVSSSSGSRSQISG